MYHKNKTYEYSCCRLFHYLQLIIVPFGKYINFGLEYITLHMKYSLHVTSKQKLLETPQDSQSSLVPGASAMRKQEGQQCSSVVEHVLSMCKVLGLFFSTSGERGAGSRRGGGSRSEPWDKVSHVSSLESMLSGAGNMAWLLQTPPFQRAWIQFSAPCQIVHNCLQLQLQSIYRHFLARRYLQPQVL